MCKAGCIVSCGIDFHFHSGIGAAKFETTLTLDCGHFASQPEKSPSKPVLTTAMRIGRISSMGMKRQWRDTTGMRKTRCLLSIESLLRIAPPYRLCWGTYSRSCLSAVNLDSSTTSPGTLFSRLLPCHCLGFYHVHVEMTPPPALILNVDDSEAGRYTKSRLLQSAGYMVIDAATGADALALTRERLPDLVLLDVRLPDLNGIEVCRQIKSDPALEGTMVLQTSAQLTGSADRIRGLEVSVTISRELRSRVAKKK